MAFAGDGRHFVTGGQDGSVVVWALRPTLAGAAAGNADQLWNDLASDDADKAFKALAALGADPAAAVKRLSEHLRPVAAPNDELVREKLHELDSSLFATRQKAQDDLIHMGDPVRGHLEKAAADRNLSEEVKQRLVAIMKRLDGSMPTSDRLRELRALELLERVATKDAQDLLQRLAEGAPRAVLTQEARATLTRIQRR
jgi:hypothetical protein